MGAQASGRPWRFEASLDRRALAGEVAQNAGGGLCRPKQRLGSAMPHKKRWEMSAIVLTAVCTALAR